VECKVHSIPVERQWLHRAWLKREFIVDYMHLGDQRADTVFLRKRDLARANYFDIRRVLKKPSEIRAMFKPELPNGIYICKH